MALEDLIVFEGALLVFGLLLARTLQMLHTQGVLVGLAAGVLDVIVAGILTIFIHSKRISKS